MDAKHCRGCRDDFYNQPGNSSDGKCWMLKSAKLVTRYRIHRDVLPASPGAFTEMVVPDCYGGAPWYYCKQLPDFVKAEDVVRRKAAG